MSYFKKTLVGGIIFLFFSYLFIGREWIKISVTVSFGVMGGFYVFVSYFIGELFFRLLALLRKGDYKHYTFNYLLNILILVSLVFFSSVFFLTKKLPELGEINQLLLKNPVQTSTEKPAFEFDYRDEAYKVIPLADYELYGLVVSQNDINKWYNYYKDKDSVNLKDICVVWGENISNGVYDDIRVKNGEWTCYVGAMNYETYYKFHQDQLSNNHLLTADEKIQDMIRNLKIGDQIRLKGSLVKFGNVNYSENYYQSSSLTRTDTGNGACESIYVDEFDLLEPHNEFLYLLKDIFWYLFLTLIAFKVFKFFI